MPQPQIQDQSKTPAVAMALLVPGLAALFRTVVAGINALTRQVYGIGTDSGGTNSATAMANVVAMGVNAALIFTVADTFETAVNAVAPLLTQPTIDIMPPGYTFSPSTANDGTGTLTYVAPAATPTPTVQT